MTEEDYDFREDSRFSKYELDVAAEEQAVLYGKWARLYADAEDEVRDFEKKIRLLESKYYLHLMKNWKNEGFEKKPTDKGVENWYTTQADYQDLQNELLNALRKRDIFKEAKTTLHTRKKMIEVEANLYISGFWAKPEFSKNAESNLKEIKKEERNRRTSELIKEKMERRMSAES